MKDRIRKSGEDHGERFDAFLSAARSSHPAPSAGFEERVMRAVRGEVRADTRQPFLFRRVFVPLAASLLFVSVFVFRFVYSPEKDDPHTARVEFSVSIPGAKTITLVGDFNSWKGQTDRMERINGHWKISKRLRRGRYYKYAFMVDGAKIVNDDTARQYVDDGFGGRTSVVFVN